MKAVFIILSVAASALAQNYCSICSNHIACGNNGQIAAKCRQNAEMINMASTGLRTLMTDMHNEKRNLIASGKLPRYQPASRMPTMQWDDELAYLAGLNVKTCNFGHDACRNTQRFQYSGQNLAWWGGYPAITPRQAATQAIENWFNEYENTDMSAIDSYYSTPKPNGHFTVMVADRNIRLGCAMIKVIDGRSTTFTTACNYATTNMRNRSIYTKGATGSRCTTGRNQKYPALCSTNEQIDVNRF